MENSVQVLEIIVPVIVMIIAGMFFREKQVLSDEEIGTLKHLLVNFCIPALVFKTFYSRAARNRPQEFPKSSSYITRAATLQTSEQGNTFNNCQREFSILCQGDLNAEFNSAH